MIRVRTEQGGLSMIRNVIFDFGQVMVRFDPAYMVAKYIDDPTDRQLVETVLFDRLYWDKSDRGTITDAEILEAACARLPQRLHDVAKTIYDNWIYNLPEIEGMRALVRELKKRHGIHVYLLSNISTYFAAHAHEIPCLADFEDCVFSAVCGKVKPNPDIFAYLCGRNGLNPTECIFVDDNAANIAGAEAFGIKGYLFDGDASRLKKYLIELLEE